MNTKESVKFIYKNENLQINDMMLKPSNSLFFTDLNATSTYTFSGDTLNAKFILSANGFKNRTFEKVKRITLTTAQLQEYKGEFYSPELDTKYKISTNENELLVKIPRNDEMKFSPFISDMFSGNFTITFSRDKANKINGFFITTGRIRNLYFEKLITI